jgi:cytochrome c-type biogenesis protein CcmH/NrfF
MNSVAPSPPKRAHTPYLWIVPLVCVCVCGHQSSHRSNPRVLFYPSLAIDYDQRDAHAHAPAIHPAARHPSAQHLGDGRQRPL